MIRPPRRQRLGVRRRAVVFLPNGATLFNLLCGIYAIVLASRGDFTTATLFVVIGGVADTLDGRIARATGTGSRFGEELDSLVDAISFGLAPAMIMYFAVLNRGNWEWLLVFIFTACAVMRLARFNVEQAGRKKTHFHGLPSPAAGLTLATYYWFSQTPLYNQTVILFTDSKTLADLPWHKILSFLMALLAALMISDVPYPAVPTVGYRSRRSASSVYRAPRMRSSGRRSRTERRRRRWKRLVRGVSPGKPREKCSPPDGVASTGGRRSRRPRAVAVAAAVAGVHRDRPAAARFPRPPRRQRLHESPAYETVSCRRSHRASPRHSRSAREGRRRCIAHVGIRCRARRARRTTSRRRDGGGRSSRRRALGPRDVRPPVGESRHRRLRDCAGGSLMKFGIVTFPGSNCDYDAYQAVVESLGEDAVFLWHKDHDLQNTDVIILPGGFSYGDYLRPGAIARFSPIMREVLAHVQRGGPVLAVCNGFQIACEAGMLPGALLRNASLKFVCEQTRLRVENADTTSGGAPTVRCVRSPESSMTQAMCSA